MKAPLYSLIIIGLLNLGLDGFLTLKVSRIEVPELKISARSVISRSRPPSAPSPIVPGKVAGTSDAAADPRARVDLHKAKEIIPYINQNVAGKGIEGLARALAEMDEWQFRPEDEALAREELEGVMEALREKATARITDLSKSALESENGRGAAEKMGEINSVLSLYPTPTSTEDRKKLERITAELLRLSRRVEDIRRLRYNRWAVGNIDIALADYHKNKKTLGTDKDALTKSCVDSLKLIDPAFLEPAMLDLYNYA
ncbi:MAG TPA: hypothetical protein VGN61_06300, partial [Verrucomicrobiae bacterium]